MLLSHLRGRCEVSCFFSRTPRLALSLRVSARVHPRPLECFTRHSRLRLSVRPHLHALGVFVRLPPAVGWGCRASRGAAGSRTCASTTTTGGSTPTSSSP